MPLAIGSTGRRVSSRSFRVARHPGGSRMHNNANELCPAALERASPAEGATFLDGACSGDMALRAEVEALLRSHEEAGGFLEPPVAAASATGDYSPESDAPDIPPADRA